MTRNSWRRVLGLIGVVGLVVVAAGLLLRAPTAVADDPSEPIDFMTTTLTGAELAKAAGFEVTSPVPGACEWWVETNGLDGEGWCVPWGTASDEVEGLRITRLLRGEVPALGDLEATVNGQPGS